MFRFKQFTISQSRSPMKVGTDSVLLGAWVGIDPNDRRILDIGTGTGLIALMLAQRNAKANITGIDIADIEQARENAGTSPWAERLSFIQIPVQKYETPERFDLIVSNPPFFVDSLLCPDVGRTAARHTVQLPFEELRDSVVRLLAERGCFAVILPIDEAERFILLCKNILSVIRRTDVRTTPRHAPKRVLLEFSHDNGQTSETEYSELVIGTGEHEEYTPEYRLLTRDFYLKF